MEQNHAWMFGHHVLHYVSNLPSSTSQQHLEVFYLSLWKKVKVTSATLARETILYHDFVSVFYCPKCVARVIPWRAMRVTCDCWLTPHDLKCAFIAEHNFCPLFHGPILVFFCKILDVPFLYKYLTGESVLYCLSGNVLKNLLMFFLLELCCCYWRVFGHISLQKRISPYICLAWSSRFTLSFGDNPLWEPICCHFQVTNCQGRTTQMFCYTWRKESFI